MEECYAIVEAHLKSQSFGGLTYFSEVNIDNSYALSDVRWVKYGNFGGLVVNQGDQSVINNSWCASGLDWTWTMEDNKRPGGAVMKRMDTKPGFDFAEIWGRRNDLNDGYPYLRWTAPGLENDPDETAIPVDLVTCSGSGLDPHISPAAAEYQVARIAKANDMTEEEVREIIMKCTDGKFLGLFGEETVNVLKVNLMLDGILEK